MTNIALVAIDIDSTLLTSKGELPSRCREVIKQCSEQGVYIILATTRNPVQVAEYSRQLDLLSPMVCTNGAQVWASPYGPVWACHTITQQAALAIAKFADEYRWELSTTVGEMMYWRRRQGQTLGLLQPGITIVERNADAIIDPPVRILAHDPQSIEQIHILCKEQYHDHCGVEIYYKADGEIDSLAIFAPHVNKRTGIELVLNKLGLFWENVMAIGDNMNDLPMLTCAGFPIAVGNAVEEVKQVAKVVAPDNDHEGVAWALETYVLS